MNVLIQQNQKTDIDFEIIYKKYWYYVYSIVAKYIQCIHIAEDISQDVFLAYLEKMHSIKNVKSWLSKVAQFSAIKYNRRQNRFCEFDTGLYEFESKNENQDVEVKMVMEEAFDAVGISENSKANLYNKIVNKTYVTVIAKEKGTTRRVIAYQFKKNVKKLTDYFSSIGIRSVCDF